MVELNSPPIQAAAAAPGQWTWLKVLSSLATADGQLLPSFTPAPARANRTPALVVFDFFQTLYEAFVWIVERMFLLTVGLLNMLTAPAEIVHEQSASKNGGWKIAYGMGGTILKILALFSGVCIASFHGEYLNPHGLDAYMQFTYDSFRLSVSPSGGFSVIPIPTPLPRPLEEEPPKLLLHHMTVATRFEENIYRLLRTATWHGNAVDVLGRNDPRFPEGAVAVKVQSMLHYCDSLPPDDVVLFTDAYDVLMLGSHKQILAGYLDVLASYPPESDPSGGSRAPSIVFTAATKCLPDEARAAEYPPEDLQHLFKYLNSGLILGSAGSLSRLLRSTAIDTSLIGDEGRWFTSLYLGAARNASLPRPVLDHETRIFLSMGGRRLAQDLVYHPPERAFRHSVTGAMPAIIHFPGWALGKETVQTWHLLQGRDNRQCGLLMCVPMYAGATLLAGLAAGAALGVAWHRLLPLCKLGRVVMGSDTNGGGVAAAW